MHRRQSGFKKVKEVFRRFVEKVLSVAHAVNSKKVGGSCRCGLQVIASKSIPEGEAHLVSPNGNRVIITNLATGNPKEG